MPLYTMSFHEQSNITAWNGLFESPNRRSIDSPDAYSVPQTKAWSTSMLACVHVESKQATL